MTAWPALALSLLALTGACPLTCGPAEDLPELGPAVPETPTTVTEDAKAVSEVDDASPTLPAEPLRLVDELTATRLPADDEPELSVSLPADPEPSTSQAAEDPPSTSKEATDRADDHVPPTEESPTAAGFEHQADARAAWPQAQGEPAGPRGSTLLVSVLLGLATIGLYHKLDKDRALEHRTRRRILELLEEQPVAGTNDVADELDVAYRTARHHLEVLARFDLVIADKTDDRWRWARPENAEALEASQVHSLQRELLAELEAEPGLHLSELARRLDAAKATVKHHLDRLDERGAVRDEHVGPLRRFFPVEGS